MFCINSIRILNYIVYNLVENKNSLLDDGNFWFEGEIFVFERIIRKYILI